jgi:hypothetical protein
VSLRNLPLIRRLRDERGIALVFALGATVALSATVAVAIDYTSANSRSSYYDRARQSAYTLAEAGINNAASVLAHASDPTISTLLPSRTDTYSTGSVTWSGTYNASNKEWSVTSTGLATQGNPAARQTLTAKIPLIASQTQPATVPAWNYVYATGSSQSCDLQLNNSVTLTASVYVVGDLCLNNTATIRGSSTVVNVSGAAYLTSPGNSIGVSGASGSIAAAHIVDGCSAQGNALKKPCDNSRDVYATISDTTLNPTPAALGAPTVDWDYWYANANLGPKAPCKRNTVTGTPPTFDNDNLRNASVAATVNLTPSSSYTCATNTGELSWNNSTKVLTIKGVIFIDGSASIDSAGAATYTGQGSLLLSGTMLMKNSRLCAVPATSSSCDTASWDQNSKYLAIETNGLATGGGSMQAIGITLTSAEFQGGLYSTAGVDAGTTSDADGGIIGSYIVLSQKASVLAASTVPTGLAGNPVTTYAVGTPYSYSG